MFVQLKSSEGKFNTLCAAPLNILESIQLVWGYHFRVSAEQRVKVLVMQNSNFGYGYYF